MKPRALCVLHIITLVLWTVLCRYPAKVFMTTEVAHGTEDARRALPRSQTRQLAIVNGRLPRGIECTVSAKLARHSSLNRLDLEV